MPRQRRAHVAQERFHEHSKLPRALTDVQPSEPWMITFGGPQKQGDFIGIQPKNDLQTFGNW